MTIIIGVRRLEKPLAKIITGSDLTLVLKYKGRHMSRGIGKLQRNVLRLVFDHGSLLRRRVILSQMWGWRGKPWRDGHVFVRSEVGHEEYRKRHSSLTRALLSLQRRGLVQIYKNISGSGTAVGLTVLGRQVAQAIAESEGDD